jgi:hypothetical protein
MISDTTDNNNDNNDGGDSGDKFLSNKEKLIMRRKKYEKYLDQNQDK